MPGVFAEFEANLRRERQLEGKGKAKAKAKAAGAFKGRPASIDAAISAVLGACRGLGSSPYAANHSAQILREIYNRHREERPLAAA
jgi:DNA invertase Pin-like site-specific DNA recombinase